MKALSKIVMTMAVTLFSVISTAQAAVAEYETVVIPSKLIVAPAAAESVRLSGVHYIKNIIVQAEGIGSDSTVEVMVNGQVKGTIYAPGRDPSYVVTIEDATGSFEFRHRDGGRMRILSIVVTQSVGNRPNPAPGYGHQNDKEQIRDLALTVLEQVNYLSSISTPEQTQQYLFPIKKTAGLVHVMSSAHGNLSKATIVQLRLLIDHIDFAHSYLAMMMRKDEAFDSVVELLTVRETLVDLLD